MGNTEKEKGGITKSNKPKYKDIGKLSTKRKILMSLSGILFSVMICLVVGSIYYNYIRYPDMMEYKYKGSGKELLDKWVSSVATLNKTDIETIISDSSYIAKEVDYANGKEYQLNFIKRVLETVSYEPDTVLAYNKYGNPMLDEENNKVYIESLVNNINEEISLEYIDYTKIPLDAEKISALMKENELEVGCLDYSNRLVKVFCEYIVSLEKDDMITTSIKRVPFLVKSNGYCLTKDEDIYLDKLLFSSEEFYDFLLRFSLVAGVGSPNPEWDAWNKLSEDEKAKVTEPDRVLGELQPRKEWLDWDGKGRKGEEPIKYNSADLISMNWCGSYHLLHEFDNPISAEVGDGTSKNPAGLNTDIVTSIFVEENGERVAKPVRVKLSEYRVSQDAIDYFESKDERNRGFDIKSEIQYTSYTLEVTNLSDSEITIYDDSSLCDSMANMSPRTGRIYGLQDKITLKPNETGVIESWGCSTELNKKYLVWGKNFQREADVVWFRVLSGNIDDPSENKGVTINNSRYE